MEWLKLAYETFGAKHPTASFIAVMVLGAIVFGGVWQIAAHQYEKAKSVGITSTPLGHANAPVTGVTVEQNSTDSPCSNVVAGKDATINCPPEQEKPNDTKRTPKSP
jgi:hypothetical protein